MSNNNILVITGLSDEMEAKDGRKYRVMTVKPKTDLQLINPTSGHKRVIWNRQPLEGDFNDYYDQIVEAFNKWQNDNGPQPMLKGEIKTVKTEPYFIESENGQSVHPETGNPANKVNQKTYVVFPDETVDRFLNNDDLTRRGESEETTSTREPQELGEEIDEEDKEEVSVT